MQDVFQQFSVYKKCFRTTSMLETYNGKLGKILPKNGNFFNFVDQLLDEEHSLTVDFLSSLEGETWQMFEKPKLKFQRRNELIERLTLKFESDRLTLTDFIRQLTSINSNNTNIDLDALEELSEEENEDDDDDGSLNSNSENAMLCGVCFNNQRNTILMPCNHIKLCDECFTSIVETANHFKNEILCPFCRHIVTKSAKVFF